jgi:hypothetical protein
MIFHNFLESNFSLKPDMEEQKSELAPLFEPAAAPPEPAPAKAGERVTVTLDIDADILAWLMCV